MKGRYAQALASLIVSVCLLAESSCVSESDNERDFEARIVLGRSIDNVMIGDDSLTVVRKIGEPDTIVGDDFQGVIFKYFRDENPYSFMMILIAQNSNLVSGTRAFLVEVQSPYSGETREGVGIGTLRDDALRLLGVPTSSDTTGSAIIVDYYNVPPPPGGLPTLFLFVYDFGDRKCIRIQMRG